MHDDTVEPEDMAAWGPYLARLDAAGRLAGGSSLGPGTALRRAGRPAPGTDHLVGYVVVYADDVADASALVGGNPVYEAGGTVEVRELVED